MDAEREEEVRTVLEAKLAGGFCGRCGQTSLQVSYFSQIPVWESLEASGDGNPAYLATVVVICRNCGALWHHATKPLGIRLRR